MKIKIGAWVILIEVWALKKKKKKKFFDLSLVLKKKLN